jgi:hypothetical protein
MLRLVKEKWHRLLPIAFLALFALSRWPGLFPPGFSAAYALVFCAAVYLPKRVSWWVPLLVMLATDVGLNLYYQHAMPDYNVWNGPNLATLAFNYAAYIAINFLGRRFKPQSSFVALLGGGLLGAILFFLITNIASWFFNPFHNPEYTKTIAGLIRALTIGISGWPTTLEFFRNTLLSGGLFTGLLAAAMKLTAPAESPQEKEAGNKAAEPETDSEETPEEAKA